MSLWQAVLPPELLTLPAELARVDALLDDPMFLKFRYRLGYESLFREVRDSITWRRFCRIPLDGAVPHPTTLMKLNTRWGVPRSTGLNEALLAEAVGRSCAYLPGSRGHDCSRGAGNRAHGIAAKLRPAAKWVITRSKTAWCGLPVSSPTWPWTPAHATFGGGWPATSTIP